MRIAGIVVGVLVAAMGLVWTLQGLNSTLVPRSFMTGTSTWVVIGLVTIAAGSALALWNWRQRS